MIATVERPATRSRAVRVLLAEDDDDLRNLFAAGLRRHGYEVTVARDGHEMRALLSAIHHAKVPRPDAIVMDVKMPVFSGLELLCALTAANWTMPVILMTGFGDVQVHARAHALGAYELLDKPLDTRELVTTIDRAIR